MLWYKSDRQPRELVSYLTLRKVVGIMGVSLPALCYVLSGFAELEESISAYYGTGVRDVFVGILFAIAWFLFAYRGYEPRDDFAGDLACLFALGVALFPTTSESELIQNVHFVCAAALFLVLAYFSLFLFTKGDEPFSDAKKRRNQVYRACGAVMLVSIALVPPAKLWLGASGIGVIKPVFWLETSALVAFGVSWMTKGKALLSPDAKKE
jgi:hypothetical protein